MSRIHACCQWRRLTTREIACNTSLMVATTRERHMEDPLLLLARKIGRRMGAMGYYPLHESEEERVRTSIRLTPEQQADAALIAQLWIALDDALGVKRPGKKWSATSVLERLVAVGLDGFWAEVGGRPSEEEDRAEFIRRAVERLRKKRR